MLATANQRRGGKTRREGPGPCERCRKTAPARLRCPGCDYHICEECRERGTETIRCRKCVIARQKCHLCRLGFDPVDHGDIMAKNPVAHRCKVCGEPTCRSCGESVWTFADAEEPLRIRCQEQGIENATKVTDIEWLGKMQGLRSLTLMDLKRLRDLTPLGQLTDLEALAVAGGIWNRMKVESLAPLGKLSRVRYLHITNLQPDDRSLAPLTDMASLEELDCGNLFSMDQFAAMAHRRPEVRCTWFQPFMAMPGLPCRRCGRDRQVMLTGLRKPTLCSACDADKLARHIEQFESLKQ